MKYVYPGLENRGRPPVPKELRDYIVEEMRKMLHEKLERRMITGVLND